MYRTLKVAIIALTIYPAAEHFGVLGVAGVVVGNSLVAQPVLVDITLGMLEMRAMDLLRLIVYPICGSVGMLAVVFLVDGYVFHTTGVLQLLSLVLLGVVSYGAFILGVEKRTNYGLGSLYREIRAPCSIGRTPVRRRSDGSTRRQTWDVSGEAYRRFQGG